MKLGLTWIIAIIDKSGSMWTLTKETIGSFNSFIEEQRKEPGEAYIIKTLFNEKYEIGQLENIQTAEFLNENNYVASGMTALYDAVGCTIDEIGKRLNEMREEDRPEHVICNIITDGYENSSVEYTQKRVKDMIEHQTNKYNWVFTFIGGNIDVSTVVHGLGIKVDNALNYNVNKKGTSQAYSAMNMATSAVRGGVFSSVNLSAAPILSSDDSELSLVSD